MKLILLTLLSFLAINCNGTPQNNTNSEKKETEKNAKKTTCSINTYNLTKVVFSSQDSTKIVEYLSSPAKGNDILWFARKFINIPYVASTLEIADPEQLVVNLTQLDCTTLVETVLALVMSEKVCKILLVLSLMLGVPQAWGKFVMLISLCHFT